MSGTKDEDPAQSAPPGQKARGWSHTDVGRVRDHNEDSHLMDEALQLFLVADGMGGHACGEVASALTARTFCHDIRANKATLAQFRDHDESVGARDVLNVLERAMLAACRKVYDTAQKDPAKRGMGTTCSALVIVREQGFVAHVGDSRIYLIRDGNAVQITRDHSVLNELVESGAVDESAAEKPEFAGYRNALARAVGVCAEVEVDTFQLEVLPGDAFVIGSDGLFHYVSPEEMPGIVVGRQKLAPEHMVAMANERGGHDNITCVVAQVGEAPQTPMSRTVDRSAEFARKVKAFRRIPLFRHLDYAQLIRVLSVTQVEPFGVGDTILSQGDMGDALYVVLTGKVRLEKDGVPLASVGPGSHFGELSLIDRSPRSATAVVEEDARLLNLKRDTLHDLVRKEPHIAVRLLWSVAEVFAARLRRTTEALTDARGGKFTPEGHNPMDENAPRPAGSDAPEPVADAATVDPADDEDDLQTLPESAL